MIRLAILTLVLAAAPLGAQTREEKVRNDKQKVEASGYWLYNDLPKAIAEAKSTGKPIVAVLRCIPCEECVKLDDDIIDADARIKPLLEQFVRVRIISTNNLDLSLFQFDTDQSFAVFFLNADGSIYGRFGTRSHRTNWVGDVSVDGFAEALKASLALHRDYPTNAKAIAGKRGPVPEFTRPELFPSLKSKYTSSLNYEGKVVPSCIHCHQIGDAVRDLAFSRNEKLTERTIFPFPHPKTIGLTLDPKQKAKVLAVADGSAAANAGLQVGDEIRTMAGQPLISIADVQWVLHRAEPTGADVPLEVVRRSETKSMTLKLASGWRSRDDIAWRASTWGLRRQALGGVLAIPQNNANDDGMSLVVEHVGQFAPHDVAKKAGIQKGDQIVRFDGQAFTRETDLIVHSLTKKKRGDVVTWELSRNGKPLSMKMTLP